MRTTTPLTRTMVPAIAALALVGCGLADEEPPANEGNQIGSVVDDDVTTEEAIPAPEAMEDDVAEPNVNAPGVTPNTVDGVGTGDATDEGLDY